MAYCSLSTDGYRSDILCYRRADGLYLIHVGMVRFFNDRPFEPPAVDRRAPGNLEERLDAHLDWMRTATQVRIGLPFDGKTFAYDGPRPMFAKLRDLAAMGYRVPISALQALREEVASTDGLGEQG